MRPPNATIEHVLPLVAEHMALISVPHFSESGTEPSDRIVRRLADRLHPSNIQMWAILCQADALGCVAITKDAYFAGVSQANADYPSRLVRHSVEAWLRVAGRLDLERQRPQPILQGRNLLPLGYEPGKELGVILKDAFEAQLDGEFIDLDGALEWLTKNKQ
jgi:tRNA nucleotidyltransferase (CCA-adding enzyme)